MKKNSLTREEKTIEQAVLNGEYKPVPKSAWGRYQQAATETMKKIKRINIKRLADRKGMPYQTFIGSVLHRFANVDMISIDDAEQVENFKEKTGLFSFKYGKQLT
jgi:predicted DNA binding CopG/RHH family protein